MLFVIMLFVIMLVMIFMLVKIFVIFVLVMLLVIMLVMIFTSTITMFINMDFAIKMFSFLPNKSRPTAASTVMLLLLPSPTSSHHPTNHPGRSA